MNGSVVHAVLRLSPYVSSVYCIHHKSKIILLGHATNRGKDLKYGMVGLNPCWRISKEFTFTYYSFTILILIPVWRRQHTVRDIDAKKEESETNAAQEHNWRTENSIKQGEPCKQSKQWCEQRRGQRKQRRVWCKQIRWWCQQVHNTNKGTVQTGAHDDIQSGEFEKQTNRKTF